MKYKHCLPAALFALLSAAAIADGYDDVVSDSDNALSDSRENAADPHKDEVDSLAFGNYYRMEKYSSVEDIIRNVGEPVGSSVYIPRDAQKSEPVIAPEQGEKE
jgi:hypothetical protein